MGTLYDVLGVAPSADAAEVRAAYRRAARRHHPDRRGDADAMARVNEAWQVLGNPERRRQYDLSLASPAPPSAAAPPSGGVRRPAAPPLEPLPPARFPWRLMGVMAVAGVAFVVLGVVTASDPKPAVVDNLLRPGDCVVFEANGDAAERLCTEPHDGVVEVLLADGGRCPDGTEPHRDRQGLGTACVRLP